MTEKYNRQITGSNRIGAEFALQSAQTKMRSEDLNINSFTSLPEIGSYVLSGCKTMAYQVLSYRNAIACGQRLTVVFLADPTAVCAENPFGDEGVEIDVHNSKGCSHCVNTYYLAIRKGYRLNLIM